jgi:hypothetical protein
LEDSVKKQEVVISSGPQMDRVIELLKCLDLSKKWKVSISPVTAKRSVNQNALMWKWLNHVSDYIRDHTGDGQYTPDQLHEFFKRRFAPASCRSRVSIGGHEEEHITTTKMTKHEMSEYMMKISIWCAQEMGIMLPHPEDMHLEGR